MERTRRFPEPQKFCLSNWGEGRQVRRTTGVGEMPLHRGEASPTDLGEAAAALRGRNEKREARTADDQVGLWETTEGKGTQDPGLRQQRPRSTQKFRNR